MVSRSHASRRQPRTRTILALLVATLVVSPALVATTTAAPAAANDIQLFTIEECVPTSQLFDRWLSNITPDPSVALGADADNPTPFPGGGGGYFNDGSVPGALLDGGGKVRIALPTDCGDVRKLENRSGGAAWRVNGDGTLTAVSNSVDVLVFALPPGVTPTITGGGSQVDLTTPDTTDAIELLVEGVGPSSYVRIGSANAQSGFSLFALRTPASVTPQSPSGSGSGTSTRPAPSPADQAVSVAVEQAAGISGASSVLIRDGQPVPVTTTIAAGVGPRGGAVIEAEGLRVTVDGGRGASSTSGVAAAVGGEIVCEVCAALAAGTVIEAWVYSTPQLAAAVLVEEDLEEGECPLLRIPLGAPLTGDPVEAGAHTLQLRMYTEDGFEVVATGITVGGAVPSSIPAGEGPGPSLLPLGVLALLAGVVGATRLRRRAEAARG